MTENLGPSPNAAIQPPSMTTARLLAAARNVPVSGAVELEGATNTRDIGGWPAGDGLRTRSGALYRSGRLNELTEDDVDELASRGIRCVVDFRADSEVTRNPSKLPTTVTSVVRLPVADRDQNEFSLLDRILRHDITEITVAEMTDLYVGMLTDYPNQFASFVTVAADIDNWPLLYHCTAGKDRTGLATGLLLSALGVERQTVLDEYCVTNAQHSAKRFEQLAPELEEAGVDIEALGPLLTAPREVLAGALGYLDASFGGPIPWLRDLGGVADDVFESLRANLLIR